MLLSNRRQLPHWSSHNPIKHLRQINQYAGINDYFSSNGFPFFFFFKSSSWLLLSYFGLSLVTLFFLLLRTNNFKSISVTTVSPTATVVTTTTATSSLANVKLSPGTIIKNFFKFVSDPFFIFIFPFLLSLPSPRFGLLLFTFFFQRSTKKKPVGLLFGWTIPTRIHESLLKAPACEKTV